MQSEHFDEEYVRRGAGLACWYAQLIELNQNAANATAPRWECTLACLGGAGTVTGGAVEDDSVELVVVGDVAVSVGECEPGGPSEPPPEHAAANTAISAIGATSR